MIDTSQQDSNPPTPQAALVSTVSFRDLKKIRPLNPTSPDDLKELLRIVSHLTSLFTYENAHWQILPNQKIVLPLLFSPQDEELYTTDQPRNSRTVTNPERTLFGTDIATMLAQVANQLQLNGFVDQQSVIHYLDEVASQGNPGQYSEEQLYKELHRIVDFGNFLSGQLRIRLQTITQETESTAEEKTEVETTPPEPDQPKTQETATAKVAGQRQSSDDTGGGESSEETDNLTTEQKNELKATADHDRRALLISYEGLLANTASFLAAAQGNFSIDDLSETQRAYFLNEARAFIKERYGDTIPKLSFAERRKMVREFQIKMLGSVAGAFDTKAEFEKGLKNVLGRDDTGLNKTIENSISAMVQASGPKAIIEMLEHLDTNDSKLLAQILGITENLSPEQYAQLKNIVLSYTQCHASELTLVAADKELFARFEAVAPNLADKGFQKQVDAFRSVIKKLQ